MNTADILDAAAFPLYLVPPLTVGPLDLVPGRIFRCDPTEFQVVDVACAPSWALACHVLETAANAL